MILNLNHNFLLCLYYLFKLVSYTFQFGLFSFYLILLIRKYSILSSIASLNSTLSQSAVSKKPSAFALRCSPNFAIT